MPARRTGQNADETRRRPATTPEQREQQLSSLAYDLAEKQILEGSASSQVITHFLKAGSGREELERLKIDHENELLRVKREAIESAKRVEELYENAIMAMRRYSGQEVPEEVDDVQD